MIEDQPPPAKTGGRAVWEDVIAFVEPHAKRWAERSRSEHTVWSHVIEDMRERDRIGRERYGTPLTTHNGRDHLIDAYQEALDLAVYLAAWLIERGYSLAETIPVNGEHTRWVAYVVQSAFHNHIYALVRLRAIVDDLANPGGESDAIAKYMKERGDA